jgi:glycogen phosphorylase
MVFLEDYDMTLAQELAAGIDVWINTPRRPMEACGTSGMKVLVNGGLNLSELDGWWAEAYTPKVGWAIGDGREDHQPGWDAQEANQLYSLLEQQIIPEFYNRDEAGIPRAWMDRVRASMSLLTPDFSSNRMLREYVEKIYLPAAQAYRERATDGGNLAKELEQWNEILSNNWQGIRFGDVRSTEKNDHWFFEIQVYLDDVMPDFVNVELYAEPQNHEDPVIRIMTRKSPLPGSVHGFLYIGEVPNSRPANHYTPRVVPYHPKASIPLEGTYIRWLT